MKVDRKNLAFLFLGALIAISIEQLGWWQVVISNPGKVHNDFWIIISEEINTSQQGSDLVVLYSTNVSQANLVFNIWKILLVLALIALALILWKR